MSYYDLALEYFPESRFVHLFRHPLKTARSEANRELWLDKIRFPWRKYRTGDGRRLFTWSLTGDEPIYREVGLDSASLFQRYVIQWIEIENRAMQFLDEFGLHQRCVRLHSPHDLNDAEKMRQAIAQLELEPVGAEVEIAGKQNRTPGAKTTITGQEEDEFRTVIERMPTEKLAIFQREPYAGHEWAEWLRK